MDGDPNAKGEVARYSNQALASYRILAPGPSSVRCGVLVTCR
jgi:hypothetical protein